ncbi:hypothetical protein L484_012018 [Morus notabilis]|uniref:Uncharacterized protein n=1 Tax=Morus notabilis TaxID=981085 RepID=W9SBL9_9ROSA|nr:hypothetical protein L484_012018 [Morus notabilis]
MSRRPLLPPKEISTDQLFMQSKEYGGILLVPPKPWAPDQRLSCAPPGDSRVAEKRAFVGTIS